MADDNVLENHENSEENTQTTRLDKNQAVIEFLLTCPLVQNSPLYFNFVEAQDKDKQFLTLANDTIVNKPYIDGSVLKRYTFTIQDFRSIAFNALNALNVAGNENVEDMLDCQGLIDWITEQAESRNYPNFGDKCIIESMEALTDNPDMNGVQSAGSLYLAKYSVNIRIEYLDISKRIY